MSSAGPFTWCRWKHAVWTLLHLDWLTHYNVVDIHPCVVWMCNLFLFWHTLFHCMELPPFVCPSTRKCKHVVLDILPLWIKLQWTFLHTSFCRNMLPLLLGKQVEVEWLDHMVGVCLHKKLSVFHSSCVIMYLHQRYMSSPVALDLFQH